MSRSKLYPQPSFFFNLKVFLRGMAVPLLAFGILIFTSAIIFSTLENRSLLDSIYFTVITITTVGYGNVHPTKDITKITTMITLIIGIITLSFASRYLVDYVVNARDKNILIC